MPQKTLKVEYWNGVRCSYICTTIAHVSCLIFYFDVCSPVESVMFFPNGSLLASAGVNDIRIWDLIAGKLLAKFNPHNKTVTCLGMAMNNSRLVTGSLDRQVRQLTVTIVDSLVE